MKNDHFNKMDLEERLIEFAVRSIETAKKNIEDQKRQNMSKTS